MKQINRLLLFIFLVLLCASFCFAQKKRPSRVLGRAEGAPPAPEKRIGAATATFFRFNQQEQITVQSDPLPLQGNTANGIFLIANFIVLGRRVSAPKAINLEFLSYSNKRRFAVNRQLQIYADNKSLYSGTLIRSSAGGAANGIITEVLDQRISYQRFLQLIESKAVKFILGGTAVGVGKEHLDALHDLKKCVDSSISFP